MPAGLLSGLSINQKKANARPALCQKIAKASAVPSKVNKSINGCSPGAAVFLLKKDVYV
jgi:hypothetical protein